MTQKEQIEDYRETARLLRLSIKGLTELLDKERVYTRQLKERLRKANGILFASGCYSSELKLPDKPPTPNGYCTVYSLHTPDNEEPNPNGSVAISG